MFKKLDKVKIKTGKNMNILMQIFLAKIKRLGNRKKW